MTKIASGFATGIVCLLSACSSHYTPRPRPRVTPVLRHGQPAFARGGQLYTGWLGGGLVDAVDDDPQAQALARTYHRRTVAGTLLTIGALGCIGLMPLNPLLGLGCLAIADGTGFGLIMSAVPYATDAVNVYNDGVEARSTSRRAARAP